MLGEIQVRSDLDDDDDDDDVQASMTDSEPQVRGRLRCKFDKLLHPKTTSGHEETTTARPVDELLENPAFDPSQLEKARSKDVRGTADRAVARVVSATKAVVSPKSAAKSRAVASLSTQDRPYLSQQSDVDYHDAQLEVLLAGHAEVGSGSEARGQTVSHSATDRRKQQIQLLDETRDARKVAWTTAYHIKRVAVVPTHIPDPPDRRLFRRDDPSNSGHGPFDRLAYYNALARWSLKVLAIRSMGEIDVDPQQPFSKGTCLRYLERMLLATAPWQSWLLGLRALHRWEEPRKTAKWATIWFLIWYLDFVMTFVFAWTAFIVLRKRFARDSTEELFRAYRSDVGDDGQARRLHELIRRHGDGDWLEPFIEEVGPVLQMQLADLVDFLEVLVNFYEWTYPDKTWATLFWFASATLLGAATETGYSLKILWMFCLLAFFLSRPIASRHPQYRHVVNAAKWIFWDIPNDADWSMMYLRDKARETRQLILEEQVESTFEDKGASDSDTSDDTDSAYDTAHSDVHDSAHFSDRFSTIDRLPTEKPLLRYRVRYSTQRTNLHILPRGIRLSPARFNVTSAKHVFFYWQQIRELRKIDSLLATKIQSQQGLDIVIASLDAPTGLPNHELRETHDATLATGMQILRLSNISSSRDEVFNVILGFSGLKFQSLQPLNKDPEKDRAKPDPNDDRPICGSGGEDQPRTKGEKMVSKVRRGLDKGIGVVRRMAGRSEDEADSEGGVARANRERSGTGHNGSDGDDEDDHDHEVQSRPRGQREYDASTAFRGGSGLFDGAFR